MHDQMYFMSPFGLERVRAEHRFIEGWGWTWAVSIYSGHHWATVDSGHARSDRRCLELMAECLATLAEYEDAEGLYEDLF